MSQMTQPGGPTGPIGSPVGPMGPMDSIGGSIGGSMGGSMGSIGGPMTAPMGEPPTRGTPTARPEPIALKSMAKVDLLPLEIVENRAFARVRRSIIALIVISVLIAAGAVYWAHSGISSSQQKLDAARAQQRAATAAQTQYATLPQLEAQLTAAKATRLTAMGQDVLFYRLLNDVKNSLPVSVTINTINTINTTLSAAGAATATPADAAATGAGAAGALTPSGIGTVQLSGTASSYAVLAGWLNTAGDVNGIDGVSLSSASEVTDSTGTIVSFNATAVLTAAALSNRYTKEG